MEVWYELGIEATHDQRAIKRAYAKRLKNARPDERPESFKRLHAAYKMALAFANSRQAYHGSNVGDDVGLAAVCPTDSAALASDNDRLPDPLPETPVQDVETRQQESDYWKEEMVSLLNKAKRLLGDSRELYLVDSWRFFEKSPLILDMDFNEQLAAAVFYMLTEHQRTAKKYYQLSRRVVTYLDTIFGWSRHPTYYYSQFGRESADRIFRLVEEYTEPARENMGLKGGKKLILSRPSVDSSGWQDSPQKQQDNNKGCSVVIMVLIVVYFLAKIFSF